MSLKEEADLTGHLLKNYAEVILRIKDRKRQDPQPQVVEVDRPVIVPGEPAEVTIRRLELDHQRREAAERKLEAEKVALERQCEHDTEMKKLVQEREERLKRDQAHFEFMAFMLSGPKSPDEILTFRKRQRGSI